MKSKIIFVKEKIDKYGFWAIWKYVYKKYTAELFSKTFLGKYILVKGRDYRIHFSKTNVAKALYLFPNLHDGDVNELLNLLARENIKSSKEIVFVDLGANIGTITLPIAKFLKNRGTVYSIEAHPKTYFELQKNIFLNKLSNVKTWNIAVGKNEGLVYFSNKKNDDANNITVDGEIVVPCFTLDTLFKDFKKIDILKIDVEGFEKFVLENALETLKKTKCIYIEYLEETCEKFGYKRKDLKRFLELQNFECYLSDPTKHQNPDIDNLICVNKNIV